MLGKKDDDSLYVLGDRILPFWPKNIKLKEGQG